jgi:hypothetical protein
LKSIGQQFRFDPIFSTLVAGVQASGMHLTEYGSEADIAAAIQKRLQG